MKNVNITHVVEHAYHMQVQTDLGERWVPKSESNNDYVELVERLEQDEFQATKAVSDIPFTAIFAPNE